MSLARLHTQARQLQGCFALHQQQQCYVRASRPSVATHVVVEGQATSAPPAPMSKPVKKPPSKNLKGPNVIKINSTFRKEAIVTTQHDPGADVGVYMSDFANNFSSIELPLGGGMVRRSAEVFEITIPRFSLFDVTLQPRVLCDVRSEPTLVDVRSRECVVTGSSHVERLKLNDRFDLAVDVAFSWSDPAAAARMATAAAAPTAATAGAPTAASVNPQAAAQSGGQLNTVPTSGGMPRPVGSSSSPANLNRPLPAPRLIMNADLTMAVDVPMPFNLVPKGIMESTCNAAMKTTLTVLLNAFAESLSADYAQWATDPRMRAAGPRALKLRSKGSPSKR